MKKLLLIISCLSIGFSSFGQGLEFLNLETKVGEPSSEDIGNYFTVKNASDQERAIKVYREAVNMYGQSNWFCWVLCWGDFVSDSPYPITLAPGESTEEFSAHFNPAGMVADDWQMRYCFYDVADSANFQYCTMVNFSTDGPVSVNEADRVKLGNPQPNPATDRIQIPFEVLTSVNRMEIAMYNVLGSEVKREVVFGTEGIIELEVSDLVSGLYIYSLLDDNGILSSGRIVVQ